mgnify:CR=1 FL=1
MVQRLPSGSPSLLRRLNSVAVLRAIPLTDLPPGGLRLLLELGEDMDRSAVASLLSSR